MFEEYKCGCIVSPFQGRVRFCAAHRIVVNDDGLRVIVDPTGRVVRIYPANGRVVSGWNGR